MQVAAVGRQERHDAGEPVEHVRARNDVVVEIDLDGGRAPERRDPIVRGLGVVDDPVDAFDGVAGERARTGRRDAARQDDGGRGAPRAGRLGVGPASLLAAHGGRQADRHIGAVRVVGVGRGIERHRRPAARERERGRQQEGCSPGAAGHPPRLPAAQRADHGRRRWQGCREGPCRITHPRSARIAWVS